MQKTVLFVFVEKLCNPNSVCIFRPSVPCALKTCEIWFPFKVIHRSDFNCHIFNETWMIGEEWRQRAKAVLAGGGRCGRVDVKESMTYCVGRAARQLGDMLLRAVPFSNTFCRDPAPFLSNQRHPPCAGQRCAKIIWKLDTSHLARTVITFAITMEGRQRTVMPNWHDLLVQFKNFITFCLAATTTSSSCADAHFLYPSILVFTEYYSGWIGQCTWTTFSSKSYKMITKHLT